MKAQLWDKWVNALESGEWDQIEGRLNREGGYCCLGVLARCDGYSREILANKASLCGLAFRTGDHVVGGLTVHEENELASRNDSMNWTFPQIAQWIRTHITREEPTDNHDTNTQTRTVTRSMQGVRVPNQRQPARVG